MNDIKDYINKKRKEGFKIGISIDIRKVENFFKNLFGISKKKRRGKKNVKKRKR